MEKNHLEIMSRDKPPILILLKYFNEACEKYANASLKELDLTLAQGHVLKLLKTRGNTAHLKELERSLNVAQSTAVGIISRLEKKGFIETKSDENDKRIKIVCLTKLGEEQTAFIKSKIESVENDILENFTDEEKETLRELIKKAVANLN